MPTPFPGMDPYLEHPVLWPNVHNSLITALRDALSPLLRPRYFVAVQERSYLDDPATLGFVTIPDASVIGLYRPAPIEAREATATVAEPMTIQLPPSPRVRETYLEVQEIGAPAVAANNSEEETARVVTLIEILSPGNKRLNEGRVQYLNKRRQIIDSMTNLVEIDLLRAGMRMTEIEKAVYYYSILVSPALTRPRALFYAFTVRDPIPSFRLPLQEDDEEPLVDLNTILHELYDRAGYDLRINYRAEATPPLEGDSAVWADELLRSAGIR
ncbi:MAG: hypothetical protein DCC55_22945 [Chloroflexi bacterium]|nr:MAG: hypothetical protein DCC55_22945 [Chloroflexota bacterium]